MKMYLVFVLISNVFVINSASELTVKKISGRSSNGLQPPLDDEEAEETGFDIPGFDLPGFSLPQFDECVQPPPVCPNENITFWFYTRGTQDNPVQIDMSNLDTLKNVHPGPGHPWKLIIHGYTGWKDYSPNAEIRPAYFEHGEYNIISVDYGPLVKEPCYYQAANNVPLVGNCTAQMIDTMVEYGVFKLEELHVIGFSLGGQVSGQVGQFVNSGKLERITGLDPALPLFVGRAGIKLDETDAKFVDVIHTNALRKGKLERSGHVDFYPNGGYSQLGCDEKSEYGSVSSCNHARAAVYFAESIGSQEGFWAVPCNSYFTFYWGWCETDESELVIMGEYTPNTARGSYYLETNMEPPYAMGKRIKESRKLVSPKKRKYGKNYVFLN